MKQKSLFTSFLLITLLLGSSFIQAQQPSPPGQVKPGGKAVNEAYLFAHPFLGYGQDHPYFKGTIAYRTLFRAVGTHQPEFQGSPHADPFPRQQNLVYVL